MSLSNDEKLEAIVSHVNLQKEGISRYLLSTSNVNHDFHTFNGIIDDDLFFSKLYYENSQSKNMKNEILTAISDDSGKNTVFILGYQGCGKSTFINSLLNDFTKTKVYEIGQRENALINFDTYGSTSKSNTLKSFLKISCVFFFWKINLLCRIILIFIIRIIMCFVNV